jgi:hypothetical protein
MKKQRKTIMVNVICPVCGSTGIEGVSKRKTKIECPFCLIQGKLILKTVPVVKNGIRELNATLCIEWQIPKHTESCYASYNKPQ